jgi:uncharacterized protein (TIGR02118 family)
MIRVSVMYANDPDAQFDHEYYATKHCPMVAEKLKSFGCQRVEIDKGLGGATPKAEAPFVAVGHIIMDSLEGFQTGMKEHGQEIMADVPNYTNLTPQVQISKMVE